MQELNSKSEKKQFYLLVFSLVLPMAAQNLINVAVSSADVVMLGMVGEISLSASSLAGQVMFILTLILFGLTSGAAVLTAQYWGKNDIGTIEKVLGIAMRIAILVSVVFTVAALAVPRQIMYLFTNEEPVIREGIEYLRIIAFSYVFVGITIVYLNVMRSVERVLISTIVYLISLGVNVGLNAVFIFGLLGFPAMGIKGAALATLIARIVEFVIVVVYGSVINKQVQFRFKNLITGDKLLARDFRVYAVPVLLNELMWGMGISTVTAIIGHMGSAMVAGNSVAQVVRQLAMVVSFGISNATAIIIGKSIGEGKEKLAKVYSKRLIKLSMIVGVLGAGLILLISPVVRRNLTLTSEAQEYLKMMLAVMAVYVMGQSFNGPLIIGVFRAGGDTKFGLMIDIGALWMIAIVFGALAAFVWKLPAAVVYMILTCDEVIKIPFSYWRYRTEKWLKNVTR